jgi:MFS family permease
MVYAAMQIPVGVLLDRFGPKLMLQVGAIAMTAGQLVVAYADTISVAYLGRMLVGMGDAFTFISMLRLIVSWAPKQRIARTQQFMVNIGQLGQLASAIPFAILLANFGWRSAFEVSASVVVIGLLAVSFFVKNEPVDHADHKHAITLREAFRVVGESVRHAPTRMSFWIHFTLQSSGSVFALLWGVPFLVEGEGMSRAFASTMLSAQMALYLAFGSLIGWIAQRHPNRRKTVVTVIAVAIISIWSVFALLPDRAPVWLLVVLVVTISAGGPGSMIAMDYSREFTPKHKLGAANGFINIGGFLATFVMMAIAGWILDLVKSASGASSAFTLNGFRFALGAQVVVIGFGLCMYLWERSKSRALIGLE